MGYYDIEISGRYRHPVRAIVLFDNKRFAGNFIKEKRNCITTFPVVKEKFVYQNFLMIHTYTINGMTCGNCVAKVKSELLKLGDIVSADIQLQSPQATLEMHKHISTGSLQQAISKAGHYTIVEADGGGWPEQTMA